MMTFTKPCVGAKNEQQGAQGPKDPALTSRDHPVRRPEIRAAGLQTALPLFTTYQLLSITRN